VFTLANLCCKNTTENAGDSDIGCTWLQLTMLPWSTQNKREKPICVSLAKELEPIGGNIGNYRCHGYFSGVFFAANIVNVANVNDAL